MKKILIIPFIVFFFSLGKGQSLYLDPTTTAALMYYSSELRKQQNKTKDEVKGLKKVQATVGVAMAEAGKIQNKVYKGLSEVSGTLSNAYQVKEIYYNIEVSTEYIKEIGQLAKRHPQYSVLSIKSAQKSKEKILQATTEISNILKGGELNLMTAGDRYKLLYRIEHETQMLRIYLLNILLPMQRAEQIGFWRAINPFQGYIDTDKTIVENILRQYEWL